MNKEEAQKLLPWFAVGALDAEEAHAVEAHLEGSPELQRELAELQVLEREVVRMSADEPEFRPELMDDALRQIDAYEATRSDSHAAPAKPGMLASAVNWLRETLVTGWVGSPAGARLAMVAQFALILVLGGILFMPPGQDAADPAYRTSSAGTSGAGSATELSRGTTLSVSFQPTVTESRMRETLGSVGGEIVAGPSRQGNYEIRVESTDAEMIDSILNQLRSQSDVIRFAAKLE